MASSFLTISDIIEICGIAASLITGIVAIIISIKTLKQNSKMIEESTRPYITIYFQTTTVRTPRAYFVIKNFGNTGATISSITCDYDLKKCSLDSRATLFTHISNTFLAPQQSIPCRVDIGNIVDENISLTFKIKYFTMNKKYSEVFVMNPLAFNDFPSVRDSSTDQELMAISHTLQGIEEKML